MWHCPDVVSLSDSIVSDLRRVRVWCDANRLVLNLEKTKMVTFRCTVQGLVVDDDPVVSKPESTFLGLIIDQQLRFEPHILSVAKKISSGCFAVRLATRELGTDVGKSVYFALIESRLRYGIAFWGSANNQLLNSLFVIQKRAVRYISKASSRTSCKPLFLRNKILTLTCLYILETACLIFANRDKFTNHTAGYETRQHMNLRLPIPSSTLVKRAIIYEGIKIFNHLPNNVINSPTVKIFKSRLRKILIDKTYYNLGEFFADRFV